MFDGFEIDMLSVGDADCIVLTQWTPFGPQRVLIDGGKSADAPVIRDFLRARNISYFWAVVCTHLHGDHARGLIKLVKDKSFTFSNAWMHNIRNHVGVEALRRASSGSSTQADGVRQVVENTDELRSAFVGRGLAPREPFAGVPIAAYPSLTVLGPSLEFYENALQEFTRVEIPGLIPPLSLASALAALGGHAHVERPASIGRPIAPPYPFPPPDPTYQRLSNLMNSSQTALPSLGARLPSFRGVLSDSSVEENPKTQPFNNTSAVIGCIFNGYRYLFTGDAGADALGRVPSEWRNLNWIQVPHHASGGNLSQELIERFCPKYAYISACGDSSHPNRAIVSGLVKVGTQVFSTHKSGNLWHHHARVPGRLDYSPAVPMRGTGDPIPVIDWSALMRDIGPGALG